MSVLGINLLNVSITALVVVFVFVCLFMVLLVLMQRPKQEGLGAAFGSGTTDQLFGARTTNVLQKGTVYCAVLFFVLTLTLAILMQRKNQVNSLAKASEVKVEEVAIPAVTESLKDELPTTVTDPVPVIPEAAAPDTAEKPAEAPVTPVEPTAPVVPVEPSAPADDEKKPADAADADKTPEL